MKFDEKAISIPIFTFLNRYAKVSIFVGIPNQP